MVFEEYKDSLLDYLNQEKILMERDIELHQDLPDEEKIEQGYLIPACRITNHVDDSYELTATENNSKLRAGDKVTLVCEDGSTIKGVTIIENFFNRISITTENTLDKEKEYEILVTEAVLLDPLINLIDGLENGAPGSFYLEELCGAELPDEQGYYPIDIGSVFVPPRLNEAQLSAVDKVLKRPTLHCIQGPPGTGKTDVLATIARIFSEKGKEVLVISNTHQAVNNALNAVAQYPVPVVKIGETLKAQELDDRIQKEKTFGAYLRTRKGKKRSRNAKGAIVGMTLHGAIINLGLRSSGFSPSIVLVDEAGQIPLTFGSAIGTFGSGSIIFIGDDRQMPPIFHPELKGDELSVSVFSHVADKYPDFKTILDTTYRMNTEITDFINKHFYKPYGISLKSLREPKFTDSIEVKSLPSVPDSPWEDYNPEEAVIVADYALQYVKKGFEVAVVTPFRKQVNCIRGLISDLFETNNMQDRVPLVDTVERLQGQSVDVIIISTSASNPQYYHNIESFILERHRMNVMCSRAKDKVIFVKNDIVDLDRM